MNRGVFKHYCGIKRDAPDGTNGKTKKVTFATAQKCLILPMASRKELENGFTVGTGYDAYFPESDQDIETGDQIVWNTKVFNVRNVIRYEVPQVGHVHALVTREDA